MISENQLRKEMSKKFDSYIENSNSLELKAEGYIDCYNDITEIIERMSEENRIKINARRRAKKLLGR